MADYRLVVRVGPAESQRTVRVGVPLTVGRDPGAAISVTDKRVSWGHARIWLTEEGRLWVRDLGSVNGTIADGHRVDGQHLLDVGSIVQIAGTFTIQVIPGTDDETVDDDAWFLDDLDTGLRHLVAQGSFALNEVIPDGPKVTLSRKGDAWWLMGSGLAIQVTPGSPFTASGRTLVLRNSSHEPAGTVADSSISTS